MAKLFKILLIIETSRAYGRKLLRGIAQYALLNGPWQIERQAPFYLQASEPLGNVSLKYISEFDGVIMREQKNIKPILESGIPMVFASYLTEAFDVPMILTDDMNIGQSVAKYYLERGFENFGFVGYDEMFWSDNRKNSFSNDVQKAGFSCLNYTCPKTKRKYNWKQEQVLLADWLRNLPKPTALMACNDDRAQQVLAACQLAKLSVPEEVAIIGVDNDEFVCTLTHPSLSSVNLSVEIAGFEAASVLDRMIRGEKIMNTIIPVQVSNIVTRQSSDILAVNDPIVAEAIHFIREHIREPLVIDDVLDAVPVSRRTLFDKFKKTLGTSVYKYIKKMRIEKIESILLSTDMTISEIAYYMGLKSDEHFAAYFSSIKGINPHKFRVKHKHKV